MVVQELFAAFATDKKANLEDAIVNMGWRPRHCLATLKDQEIMQR